MSEPALPLDPSYKRMLSIVWDARGRPDTAVPAELADSVDLPVRYLGLLVALGLGDRADEALHRDDGVQPSDREYAPPGWANLLGFETEEIAGRSMGLVFRLGRDSDEVQAWDWKEEKLCRFDAFWGRYRDSHPITERDSFEHLVWWRYGDPGLLMARKGDAGVTYDDVAEAVHTLQQARSVRPWLENLRLDLTGEEPEGFDIEITQGSGERAEVEHAKFGRGTILRRLDGDKLEIQFSDGSTRTLLSRFVTPA